MIHSLRSPGLGRFDPLITEIKRITSPRAQPPKSTKGSILHPLPTASINMFQIRRKVQDLYDWLPIFEVLRHWHIFFMCMATQEM